ncbi:MAG: hypothetical protein ACI841_003158 [Planctomycetota bacterium]|jgi:hypothetical protein
MADSEASVLQGVESGVRSSRGEHHMDQLTHLSQLCERGARALLRSWILCLLVLQVSSVAYAQVEEQQDSSGTEPAETVELKTPADTPAFEAPSLNYPSVEVVSRLFGAWDQAGGDRVQSLDLGTSVGGRVVPAIQFGHVSADTLPLEERPTVFLIGGADGRSLTGCLANLLSCHHLLTRLDALNPGLCVIAVPMASPDGLSAILEHASASGINATAVDEDEDGRADEDGADDLDGDGLLLEMLVEDPMGPWTVSSDSRFLVAARAGDARRYLRVPEGRDDDGDGRYNEDGSGGVIIDRNFPLDWRGPRQDPSSGNLPLDVPLARALADLMIERQASLVLMLQGNHGGLRYFGENRAPGLEERVSSCFARHCERDANGLRSGPSRVAGSIGAWASEALGALAIEVSVWGPTPVGHLPTPLPAVADRSPGLRAELRAPSECDRAWARWLDDQRGGVGFRNWQQVELSPNRQALVGGWEPRTYVNPPEDLLEQQLSGIGEFVGRLASSLPAIDIRVRALDQRSGITRLSVELSNTGELPSGPWGGAGCQIRVELPEGAELLAGKRSMSLGCLPGGGTSQPVDWLVRLPAGSSLRVVVDTPWSSTAQLEVRG